MDYASTLGAIINRREFLEKIISLYFAKRVYTMSSFSGFNLQSFQNYKFFVLELDTYPIDLAIQRTILKMRQNGGGCILWPDETIEIHQPIILDDYMGIMGVGMRSGCKLFNHPGPAITLGAHSTLQNFSLVGNHTTNSSGITIRDAGARYFISHVKTNVFDKGLYLNNCYIGTVIDLNADSNLSAGIYMYTWVTALKVLGGHYGGCDVGIFVGGASHMGNCISATVEGNRQYGILVDGAIRGLIIRDCWFELNNNAAICITDSPLHTIKYGTVIRDSYFVKENLCIDHQRGHSSIIEGNTFDSRTYVIGNKSQNTRIGPNVGASLPGENHSSSTTFYGGAPN